jgi:hypothetical protein
MFTLPTPSWLISLLTVAKKCSTQIPGCEWLTKNDLAAKRGRCFVQRICLSAQRSPDFNG